MRRCKELVTEACKLYGVPPIPVGTPKKSTPNTSAYYQPHYISLPAHFQRKDVALHEAAHYISAVLWPRASDHGGVFVRVYMHLLHELLGGDIKWMESWARFHNVKYNTKKDYSPGQKVLSPWEYASLQMSVNSLGAFLK